MWGRGPIEIWPLAQFKPTNRDMTMSAPSMMIRPGNDSGVRSGTDAPRPGLFLMGAMKSGTTYLRRLLASHPDIFMCEPDEPSYFVDPRQLKVIWRDMWERGFWRSEAHYLQLFRSAGDAMIVGEASTNYTKLPLMAGVPEKIGFQSGRSFHLSPAGPDRADDQPLLAHGETSR